MPKVSQQYRDARREEILAAAKRCFLRDGFHETSMQDLFAESGLSSGAVYRYFAGKQDMILAIAEENIRDIAALIHAMATEHEGQGVGDALAEVLDVVRAKHADTALGAVAVLVWSEALRTPAVAKQLHAMLADVRADLADVVRANQARGALPRTADVDALTALLMSIVPGFIVQLAIFGPAAINGVPDAARALWPIPGDPA
jgi:TetR/AcrR family transcriptional regulator, transcriptional repressor of aconitase